MSEQPTGGTALAPGILVAFDIINTLLPAIQSAMEERRDIPVADLQAASTRLGTRIDSFQAKLDRDRAAGGGG